MRPEDTQGYVQGTLCVAVPSIATDWVFLDRVDSLGGARSMARCSRCAALLGGVRHIGALVALGMLQLVAAPAQTATAFDGSALVRRAVGHRLDMDQGHPLLRFVLRKKDGAQETTKEIIETKDGDVARLIAVDGKPLSAEAERVEMLRLDFLAAHPELEEHRHRGEIKDQARIDRLLGMLPEAEIYTLEGMVQCAVGGDARGSAGMCYRMSFRPNPKFVPPDIAADFLRGFAGEVWIDKEQERLTRLQAHLIVDVNFGFGILGKVNKGGTAELRQRDVGGHEWKLTELKLNLTGRALLVKALNIQIEEVASGFRKVKPGLGYREAIEMLKHEGPAGAQP